jgi:hypothetical protein
MTTEPQGTALHPWVNKLLEGNALDAIGVQCIAA